MIITPSVTVARVAQLSAGELVHFQHGQERYIGLVCEYRDPDPSKLLLVLGPTFPNGFQHPTLFDVPPSVAVSLGTDFEIRLPMDLAEWTDDEPTNDCNCLLASAEGLFFRANAAPLQGWRNSFTPWYVNAATGLVHSSSASLRQPSRAATFVKSWGIFTCEQEPQLVIQYP